MPNPIYWPTCRGRTHRCTSPLRCLLMRSRKRRVTITCGVRSHTLIKDTFDFQVPYVVNQRQSFNSTTLSQHSPRKKNSICSDGTQFVYSGPSATSSSAVSVTSMSLLTTSLILILRRPMLRLPVASTPSVRIIVLLAYNMSEPPQSDFSQFNCCVQHSCNHGELLHTECNRGEPLHT